MDIQPQKRTNKSIHERRPGHIATKCNRSQTRSDHKDIQLQRISTNVENEDHAGIAIAVKRDLQHQVIDDFEDDVLAVKIETRKGPAVVATAYKPPRREFMSIEDLLTLFKMKDPVYFLADINARHRFIGHTDNNNIGKLINNMITKNIVSYLGPEFNTRIAGNGISRPDIILRNIKGFYNYLIQEGEVTTSDHLPIIFKIVTTAIIKECPPKRQYKRTDWTRTKGKINQDVEELNITRNLSNNPRNVDKEIIDQKIKKRGNSGEDNDICTTSERV